MADTQYIKRSVEPHVREWLRNKYGAKFSEGGMRLLTGSSHKFDAVSTDNTIVAAFVCNRPRTGTGNENTGGVRKALNDLQFLNLLPASVKRRALVFTDAEFLTLIRKRGKRVGTDNIEFLYCELPKHLALALEKVLDGCRLEQKAFLPATERP